MKRAGQPYELAPAYVYLASDDSSYDNPCQWRDENKQLKTSEKDVEALHALTSKQFKTNKSSS
jgi:hypothetical protein